MSRFPALIKNKAKLGSRVHLHYKTETLIRPDKPKPKPTAKLYPKVENKNMNSSHYKMEQVNL